MSKKAPAKKAAPKKAQSRSKTAPKKKAPAKKPAAKTSQKVNRLLNVAAKLIRNSEQRKQLEELQETLATEIEAHKRDIAVFKKTPAAKKMHPTRIFPRPEDLLTAWNLFRGLELRIQSYNWLEVQYVGKEGDRVTDLPPVPHTMEGFEIFCREHYGEVHHYFENKEGYYEEFGGICSRVKTEIRNNQIVGGMLGRYNASITQRLNALKDQTEVHQHIEQPLF